MKKSQSGRIVLLCFATYVSAYLCRVNFSASLLRLSQKLSVDTELLGIAGAVFFAVYALGQLLNGMLGDSVNPFRFILIALAGTAICNVGTGLSASLWPLLIFWGLNGYFQSMFWSTLIRILALKVEKEKQASTSSVISSAMPAGYFLSWCVLTPLLDAGDPQWNFILPAVTAAAFLPLWAKTAGENRYICPTEKFHLSQSRKKLFALVKGEKLGPVLLACICHGLIKEGIGFWIPSFIRQMAEKPGMVYIMLAMLPAANFLGTRLAKALLGNKRFANPMRLVLCCFAAMLPLCLLLNCDLPILRLILMSLISCCSYGANTVLMSYIPMQYKERNMVSSVVGALDFCSYMGAAVSTYALGSVMSCYGFSFVPWIWLGAAALAIGLLLLQSCGKSRAL